MTQRIIEELSREECFGLLAQETVGRVAFVDVDGPAAIPVNYALAGEDIVFRVEPGSHLREALASGIGFEVDHVELEPETGSGWSVLVRGAGREVELDDVPELLHRMAGHLPRPWAEGVHNIWVVVTVGKVTGRRLQTPIVGTAY
jgi:nitroimidazol reductase NimA-like FMN-containing flavoprotein (pyridoxamine 5'-phosphate oxidase superfamily)